MGKRHKPKATLRVLALSLEQQLRELDANAPEAPHLDAMGDRLTVPSSERLAYVDKRTELVTRIRKRDGKAMRDPGPDEGGRFSPSPYLMQHGHLAEVAPQDLRTSKDSNFPKRITTQRMIDRYQVRGLITRRQWRAANRLWSTWRASGLDPKMTANYSADVVSGSGDPDARMVGKGDAVAEYLTSMAKLAGGQHSVAVHVVVWDCSANDWAVKRGHKQRVSEAIGMAFLRDALDVLASHFSY